MLSTRSSCPLWPEVHSVQLGNMPEFSTLFRAVPHNHMQHYALRHSQGPVHAGGARCTSRAVLSYVALVKLLTIPW